MKRLFSILLVGALIAGLTSTLMAAGKQRIRKRDRICKTALIQEARASASQCAAQDRDRDRDRDRDQDGPCDGANCACGNFVDADGDGLCDNCDCTCDGDGPYGPQGPQGRGGR